VFWRKNKVVRRKLVLYAEKPVSSSLSWFWRREKYKELHRGMYSCFFLSFFFFSSLEKIIVVFAQPPKTKLKERIKTKTKNKGGVSCYFLYVDEFRKFNKLKTKIKPWPCLEKNYFIRKSNNYY
jgi:hypothetical protein